MRKTYNPFKALVRFRRPSTQGTYSSISELSSQVLRAYACGIYVRKGTKYVERLSPSLRCSLV
jgi:hypothetical protein